MARSAKTVRKSTFQDIVGWADYRDGKANSISGITVSNNGILQIEGPQPDAIAGEGTGYWRPFQIAFLLASLPD